MSRNLQECFTDVLSIIDKDPLREGLKETPHRVAKFYHDFLHPTKFDFTTFANEGNDEMIIVQDIPFYSLCEHHMVPFFGTAAIAYIPVNRIVGLSKIPRTLDQFARKLQNQERITQQVARTLMNALEPKGVAVVLKARHLCMEMRGVEKPGAITTTSAMLGVFKEQFNTRQEFLNLIK